MDIVGDTRGASMYNLLDDVKEGIIGGTVKSARRLLANKEKAARANTIAQKSIEELKESAKYLQKAPIKEFGINYGKYRWKWEEAIKKLLKEKQWQVVWAFNRKDIGDIDVVWGKITDAEKKKGYGLVHILDKHPEMTPKVMAHIIKKGEIVENAWVKTIIHKTHKAEYRVWLSHGWKGEGDNNWIITGYKKNPLTENFDQHMTAKAVKNGNYLSSRDFSESIIPKTSKNANISPKSYTNRNIDAPTISQNEAKNIVRKYFKDDQISVKLAEKIITKDGWEAFGMYHKKMIAFAKNPTKYTPEHEVFHAYFDMALEPKQKNAILKAIMKEKNFLKKIDAEEFMADSFSEFVVGRREKTGLKWKLANIFADLAYMFKKFFGKADKVEGMMRELESVGLGKKKLIMKGENTIKTPKKYLQGENMANKKSYLGKEDINPSNSYKNIVWKNKEKSNYYKKIDGTIVKYEKPINKPLRQFKKDAFRTPETLPIKAEHKKYISTLDAVQIGKKKIGIIWEEKWMGKVVMETGIYEKIWKKHWPINNQNLITTVNDWKYKILNRAGDRDSVNFVKPFANSREYGLLVGAKKNINGLFVATHYEPRANIEEFLKREQQKGGNIIVASDGAKLLRKNYKAVSMEEYNKLSPQDKHKIDEHNYWQMTKNEQRLVDEWWSIFSTMSSESDNIKALYNARKDKLNDIDAFVFNIYTDSIARNFEDFNRYLRYEKRGKNSFDTLNMFLKKALQKLPAYNGWVYRGVNGKRTREKLAKLQIWDIFKDKWFMSSSTNYEEALNFAGQPPIKMEIRSKTGRKIHKYSYVPDESEVLFAPNTKLQLVEKIGDNYYIFKEI